jgi:nucleotide-binding universal stress UspA family protein
MASYDQGMKGDKLFPRIVVPTDGSHLAESAAHAAAALARRAGVPLTLFAVKYRESDREELAKELEGLVATLRRDVVVDLIIEVVGPVMTVGTYVADSILDEADVDGALVCIASHGRSGLGAALLGSTTEEVLHKSPRPVLVFGPKYDARPWREDGMVVACVDGSPFSEQALPVAGEWSATFGVQLWLVQVAAPQMGPGGVSRGDFNETAYLQHLAHRSPHADFDVLHSHHPAQELADLTHRWPINVMVMATHGRSGWSRLTLGSVAMNVVHHGTCPILLVPNDVEHNSDVGHDEPAQ